MEKIKIEGYEEITEKLAQKFERKECLLLIDENSKWHYFKKIKEKPKFPQNKFILDACCVPTQKFDNWMMEDWEW